MLVDGWEDIMRRSIYGNILAKHTQYPVMLGIKGMTGERASADAILDVEEAIKKMEKDWPSIITLVTDNPTVMQAVCNRAKDKKHWLIVNTCLLLHGLNTLIGKIVAHPEMKKVITKNVKIVTFFNASHYCGGQLDQIATSLKITQSLKTHMESWWYSLRLQALSVLEHRYVFLCQKKIKGLTAVSALIVEILLCCACTMIAVGNSPGDSMSFMYHAKATFNRKFEAMNTEIHLLCLFLHPLCRRLAISNVAKSQKLADVIKIALGLVQDMGWSEQMANYSQSKGPFIGGSSDADVERLFSGLSGIQSVTCSQLTVQNLEMLGMLHNHYSYPTHQRKVHMHTLNRDLNVELAAELNAQYTAAEYSASVECPITAVDWTAPLEGPESILLDEIEAGFDELERQGVRSSIIEPDLDGNEIAAVEVYDLEALIGVDQFQAPQTHKEDIHMH
ncbi:hypothetical protein JB92DRAFT_3154691 [Gautieria morchelliformis]|nr:hypothetical protein JB92DRAFT_3154691 [Gautieria morchelliformis]